MAINQYDIYLVRRKPRIVAGGVKTKALSLEDATVIEEAQKCFATKPLKDNLEVYNFQDDFGNELKLITKKKAVKEIILRVDLRFGEEAVDRAYLIASNLCKKFNLKIFDPYANLFIKSKGELSAGFNKEMSDRHERLSHLLGQN